MMILGPHDPTLTTRALSDCPTTACYNYSYYSVSSNLGHNESSSLRYVRGDLLLAPLYKTYTPYPQPPS
jgi:hypothetical protein